MQERVTSGAIQKLTHLRKIDTHITSFSDLSVLGQMPLLEDLELLRGVQGRRENADRSKCDPERVSDLPVTSSCMLRADGAGPTR
jgi:hypothetical protein